MAVLHICSYPEEILCQRAEPVTEIDEEVITLVDHMAETMYSAPGIGLAATQVGVAKQVLVADVAPRRPESDLIVLLNPEMYRQTINLRYAPALTIRPPDLRGARSTRLAGTSARSPGACH